MPPRRRRQAAVDFSTADLHSTRKVDRITDKLSKYAERYKQQTEINRENMRAAAKQVRAHAYDEAMERQIKIADAVLMFIAVRGSGFEKTRCKQCNREFYRSRTFASYCSNQCQEKKLLSQGLEWNPLGKTDFERWQFRQPMVIPPWETGVVDEWLEKNPEQLELDLEFPAPPQEQILDAEAELEKLLSED